MRWYFGVRYNERMGVPSNTSAVEKKAVGIATNRQKLIVNYQRLGDVRVM